MLSKSRNFSRNRNGNLALTASTLIALTGAMCSFSNASAEEHRLMIGYAPQYQQVQPAQSPQPQPLRPPTAPKRTKSPDYIRNSVTDTVTMPDMPRYTGQSTTPSVSVTWDARSSDRPSYDMSFDIRESSSTALTWYKSALQNYGWSVEPDPSGRLVAATKNGRTCQVVVDFSMKDGYATQIDVFYR